MTAGRLQPCTLTPVILAPLLHRTLCLPSGPRKMGESQSSLSSAVSIGRREWQRETAGLRVLSLPRARSRLLAWTDISSLGLSRGPSWTPRE